MWSNQNEGLHKEKRNGRAGYLMNLSQHGVGEDDEGDEADRPPPQERPTRPPSPSSVFNTIKWRLGLSSLLYMYAYAETDQRFVFPYYF